MSAYIAPTVSVIENSFCQIHSHTDGLDLDVLNEGEQFGILSMKMKKTKITERPTMILFSIDNTASMEEKAYRNTTKLEIAIKTLKNIMTYLSTIDAPVYIQLYTFNLEVRSVIDTILVNKSNVEELINKIEKIAANNSTDIGYALKCANENMTKYHKTNPTHQIIHIFMTDGEPTSGECNAEKLSTMVNNDFPNIFVGFGEYHNVNLLKKLSDKDNGDYQFVDNMENTSLIYGETIHRYLYPALQNVEITIENGFIYNWKTNSWATKLYEPVIIGEIEKIYHIKTRTPYDFICDVYGIVCSLLANDIENQQTITNELQHLESISVLPALIDINTNKIEETNLAKYLYRQKTQELLYKAKESKNKDDNKIVKLEMNAFFKNMREYVKTNNLVDDKFMKNLCDDICITYRTIGTHLGAMYNISRLTTQSRQQTYSATPKSSNSRNSSHDTDGHLDDDLTINANDGYKTNNAKIIPSIAASIRKFPAVELEHPNSPMTPRLSRIKTNDFVKDYSILKRFHLEEKMDDTLDEEQEDDTDINNYNLSADINSCYATESSVNTMTQISNL